MAETSQPIYYKSWRNVPSEKTLQKHLSLSADVARKVYGVLTGKVDLMTIDAAYKRQFQAYNSHDPLTLALEAVSNLIGAYGIEYVATPHDGYRTGSQRGFDYLNKGDSYDATLVCDHWEKGGEKWRISSWGDMVEKHPSRYV